MDILYFFIGWIVGLFVVGFTLIQVLIILFFSFPITNKLEKAGLLNPNHHIRRNDLISLVILSGIFWGVWMLISTVFPAIESGFLFGGAIVLFMGLGKCGMNANNLSDYIQSNKRFLHGSDSEITTSILGE